MYRKYRIENGELVQVEAAAGRLLYATDRDIALLKKLGAERIAVLERTLRPDAGAYTIVCVGSPDSSGDCKGVTVRTDSRLMSFLDRGAHGEG